MNKKTDRLSLQVLKDVINKGGMGPQVPCMVCLSGKQAGQTMIIKESLVTLGRDPSCQIPVDDNSISRQHARIIHNTDGSYVIDDLGSTNGTFCNGKQIKTKRLEEGDIVQMGTSSIFKFIFKDEIEARYQEQMRESTTRDWLTGCYNERHFIDQLEAELSYATRQESLFSLLLFEIDGYDQVNETFGHNAGDFILSRLTKIIQNELRKEDILARIKGVRFGVVLRNTEQAAAKALGERLRQKVIDTEFAFAGLIVPLTISLSIVTYPELLANTSSELIESGSELLEQARKKGDTLIVG